jgi:hypothetical protein
MAEEAKGIPSRARVVEPPEVSKPKIWQFVRHDHEAERAGKHYDLRLGDPKTGLTYNWAGKKWPEPGQGTYVALQPTHSYEYLKFEGEIPEGYGKGKVRIGRKEPTEVVSATPTRVEFNLYKGRLPEQYVLRKVDEKRWVLNNTTPRRGSKTWDKLVPADKPKYKEQKVDKINFANPNEIFQAKIDGAHAIFALRKDKPMKAFSYRKAKSTPTGLIEHTFKIPGWEKNVVPKELDGTVLRGEIYGIRKGKVIPEKDIGAILNTSTLASREKQKDLGKLRTAVFDVVKFQGKDVTTKPYDERLDILKQVVKKVRGLHLPPTAVTPKAKQDLFQRIEEGTEKLTREGVVAWDTAKDRISKVKFRPDFDVFVRDINPSTHEGWAGSVSYSLTPKGKVVGTMGSGFTPKQREEMLRNPSNYVGRVARVQAHDQFPSGALRVPVFRGWHAEKSQEKMFKESVYKVKKKRRKAKPYELVDTGNKVIGKHETWEAAKRQERAIHARKWAKKRAG